MKVKKVSIAALLACTIVTASAFSCPDLGIFTETQYNAYAHTTSRTYTGPDGHGSGPPTAIMWINKYGGSAGSQADIYSAMSGNSNSLSSVFTYVYGHGSQAYYNVYDPYS